MITLSTIKFLKDLKKHNSKEWFDENRSRYEIAKSEYLSFVTEVLEGLGVLRLVPSGYRHVSRLDALHHAARLATSPGAS